MFLICYSLDIIFACRRLVYASSLFEIAVSEFFRVLRLPAPSSSFSLPAQSALFFARECITLLFRPLPIRICEFFNRLSDGSIYRAPSIMYIRAPQSPPPPLLRSLSVPLPCASRRRPCMRLACAMLPYTLFWVLTLPYSSKLLCVDILDKAASDCTASPPSCILFVYTPVY